MNTYSRLSLPRVLQIALPIVAVAGTLLGCSDSTAPDKSGTFFGQSVTVGDGSVRTYVVLDHAGDPTDLGVALTESALTGLPATPAEFPLTFPAQASATAYKHAVMNWQASGHGAPGSVYAVPHFDVHFYLIGQTERQAMVLGTPDLTAKMTRPPTSEFVPQGYVQGMALAQMGMHWTDPTAPEQNGQPFTRTFFYGSYDGTFMLNEPMVTKAFLETKPARVVTALKLPAQYAIHGYHATSYTVEYDAGTKEYRLALSGLVSR